MVKREESRLPLKSRIYDSCKNAIGELSQRRKFLSRRRLAHKAVASLERSPTIVALDGPFKHDHVYVRGIRLHLTVAGAASDPLILLIHGAFGGWYDYREVIEPLAACGFHVAAIDMRGYGMSDKPPAGYDHRHAAGDINGCIAALGHDSAILVGHDTGAAVAWTTATSYPERVSALVSLGTIHPLDLRRTIKHNPLLFIADITRIAIFKLPIPLLKQLRFIIPRAARKQVISNTTPSYQRNSAFSDTIGLRKKALSIDHTFAAIIRNNRLLTAAPPTKTHRVVVTAPVWLLKQPTLRWDHLSSMARNRTRGTLLSSCFPGGSEMPFLEQPVEFAEKIGDFAQASLKTSKLEDS